MITASIYLYDKDKEITASFKTRKAAVDWLFNPKLKNYRGWLHDGTLATLRLETKDESSDSPTT